MPRVQKSWVRPLALHTPRVVVQAITTALQRYRQGWESKGRVLLGHAICCLKGRGGEEEGRGREGEERGREGKKWEKNTRGTPPSTNPNTGR